MTQDKVPFFKKKKFGWLLPSSIDVCPRASQNWSSKCMDEEYYGLKFFTNSCNLLMKFSTEATIKRWFTLLFVIVFQFFKESDLGCVVSSKKPKAFEWNEYWNRCFHEIVKCREPSCPQAHQNWGICSRFLPKIAFWLHFLRHASHD